MNLFKRPQISRTNLRERALRPVQPKRYDWQPLLQMNKWFDKVHSHTQEKARRVRQIASGTLGSDNGVVV